MQFMLVDFGVKSRGAGVCEAAKTPPTFDGNLGMRMHKGAANVHRLICHLFQFLWYSLVYLLRSFSHI